MTGNKLIKTRGYGRRQTGEAQAEEEAENKLAFNTNMPFFVLNSWPTLFSARHITTYYQYTQARLLKASSVLTHTQAIQHTIHVFSLANLPVHKV